MSALSVSPANLQRLRRDNHGSRLYLAVHNPAIVYQTTLATAPDGTDKIAEIVCAGFDTDVLAGMTLWVGSSAGAYDKGQCRVRVDMSSTTLKIGEQSAVAWEVGDHLTLVDEFGLWARHPKVDDTGAIWMDYDLSYSDQHDDFDPVPVLGGPAVAWLVDGQAVIEFDGGDSWVIGSTINTYAWTTSGGSLTDADTATPTLTLTAAGVYRVTCTLTAANGKTTTARRYVFVFSDSALPITQFKLDSCNGDSDSGGMSFSVTLYAEATLATVRDRALVVLFAHDWYGDEQISIGPLPNRESILAWGWIAGESLVRSADVSSVSFRVEAAHFWLNKITAFPLGLADTASDVGGGTGGLPTSWLQMQNLTVNKAVWHFAHWRSTFTACCDLRFNSDTRRAPLLDAPGATSLWQQLVTLAEQSILAKCICDRNNTLWVEVPGNLQAVADRATLTQVMVLTADDWADPLTIERVVVPNVATLDLSGIAWDGAAVATPLFSLANGRVFKRHGAVQRIDRLLLSSQAQSNELAGLVIAQMNNEYPRLNVNLGGNYRVFDLAPNQYVTLNMAADDTPRGLEWVDKNFWVKGVSFQHEPETGYLSTQVTLEGETFPELGITGDAPTVPPETPPNPIPPAPPTLSGGDIVMAVTADDVGYTSGFNGADPNWIGKTGAITGTIVDAMIDPYDNSQQTVYVITATAVWKTTSFKATMPMWTKALDIIGSGSLKFASNLDPQCRRIMDTIARKDRVYVLAYAQQSPGSPVYDQYVYRTDTGGLTWVRYATGGNTGAPGGWFYLTEFTPTVTAHPGSDGLIEGIDNAESMSCSGDPGDSTVVHTAGGSVHDECYVEVDLGAVYTVDQIFFIGRQYASPNDRYFQWSTNGTTWYYADDPGEGAFSLNVFNTTSNWCDETQCTPALLNNQPVRYFRFGPGGGTFGVSNHFIFYTKIHIASGSGPGASGILDSFYPDDHNPNLVYAGASEGILRSTNAGATWSTYISGCIAHDIHCYYNNNPAGANLVVLDNAGNLYKTTGSALGSVLLTESFPMNVAQRIAVHTNDANGIYLLEATANETYRIRRTANGGGSWDTGLEDIDGARAIGLWPLGAHNPGTQRVYWLDSSGVHYSIDGGDSELDKTGNWDTAIAAFADPITVVPLWLS